MSRTLWDTLDTRHGLKGGYPSAHLTTTAANPDAAPTTTLTEFDPITGVGDFLANVCVENMRP